ncbi:hypothetical protein N483_12745 [Pseudoalteromonas luteoviolacea NCIMB 1944]|nr:hypothetical protein N483_12745 [Pseudoalteromonas luteoviolacea NCIMB 1944]
MAIGTTQSLTALPEEVSPKIIKKNQNKKQSWYFTFDLFWATQ